MDSNRKVRPCPECKTELLTRNFFAHLRNVHCWDEEKINEQKQKSQKQLNSPMLVSISTTSLPSESDSSHSTDKSEGIFCPADDCDYVYENAVNLANHWQQEHCSDDIQAEEYKIHEKFFISLDDFEVSSLCPGSVLATFCLGHSGHTVDVAKLPFNEAEQKFIGELIKTGKHTECHGRAQHSAWKTL
ncbi:hypothetical protein WR25_24146 [Diploscapter pachys]|uniref:C2H2-type domain-containing protein n=1 Tax=Diploscapter pachys TaxID=2018661 RepID=A0A2A2K269_9BILA|nr:hypothetical protein WR25_24146 [Diploscapter pachys]